MTCHRLAVASAVAERTERRVCAVDAGGSPKRKVLGGERFQRTASMIMLDKEMSALSLIYDHIRDCLLH